ncbi:MAG: MFS transporter [Proteobacteria bacterium]|nr:MFS transporter [Pseudomonadota bacterium]
MPKSSGPASVRADAMPFSPYQKFVAGLLAFLQFAVILDFMIVAPLGAIIMPALHTTTEQFGSIVSAYAFSAAASGVLMAGFADRFDRKRILLFFYAGFVLGTLWCGLAQSFHSLLAARIVTGLFGGVIGSVVMAIATDLYAPQQRGRVIGIIQTSFAASQILGLPISIYLSNRYSWHAPFLVMVGIALVAGAVVAWRMQPVTAHLGQPQEKSAFMHLVDTVKARQHWMPFATTALLTTGGFMLMPFSSAYVVNNLGIAIEHLPIIYVVTGVFTIFMGPLIGRIADRVGKYPVFVGGSVVSMVMVTVYTHLPPIPLFVLIAINVVLFMGIFSRMIPFQAMITSVPEPTKRGSFNAINASLQQVAGGIASLAAGHIVTLAPDGKLQHFPWIGYVIVGTTLLSLLTLWRVKQALAARPAPTLPASAPA